MIIRVLRGFARCCTCSILRNLLLFALLRIAPYCVRGGVKGHRRRSALNPLSNVFLSRCQATVPVKQACQTQAPKQDHDEQQRQAQE
jgi:hypothetical protein